MSVPTGTKQAVLYARVSTKDQEREGFSIPAQQKLLRDYARDQEFAILRGFVDAETDRAYDDCVKGRIDDAFWARKFAEWNTELTTVKTEPVRVSTAAAT